MTRIVPVLDEGQLARLRSRAEANVYRACRDRLDDRSLVVFSLPWIRIGAYGRPRDGETDFVVFDRERGILNIEVKGGGIAYDPNSGEWESIDRHGNRHGIKDPFEQAKAEKYALKDHLDQRHEWRQLNLRPAIGHAVLFPDLDDGTGLVGPARRDEILGTKNDVGRLEDWIDAVFRFWNSNGRTRGGLGASGMRVVERLFCQPVDVRPLLSAVLQEEEEERVRLTEEQARLVRGLALRKRAVVSGGAGTGKTLLALAKARALAEAGKRTLLLCYNRPLANHLFHCAEDVGLLDVMSFHQLCDWLVRRANATTGRDLMKEAEASAPSADRFDLHFPHALALATEIVDDRYEAIVVDEAQDFGEEYWLPVELLLADEDGSTFFLFFDHNQAVYKKVSTFPIQDDPFLLTRNCRNTLHIHEVAYGYYRGEDTEPPSIQGTPVEVVAASGQGGQARRLHSRVVDLLAQQRVTPQSIVVLVPGLAHEDYYALLRDRPLPRPARWAVEEYGAIEGVRIETMQRFKGLEASIVVLWGADRLDPVMDQELLYVSLSRAKSLLVLVGDAAGCERIIAAEGLISGAPESA